MADPKKAPVYHVRNVDADWAVFHPDGSRASERCTTQTDAVAHAKELARRDGIAQIVVHDLRGDVMSEFFYEREERPALEYDDTPPTFAASHVRSSGRPNR